jgi:hypothetical protein
MGNFEKAPEVSDVQPGDGVETQSTTQEEVEKELDFLLKNLEEYVLDRYRSTTGEQVTDIEDTTQEGIEKTMQAWGYNFKTAAIGAIPDIEDAIKKYGAKGFDVTNAIARLHFITGDRNRDSRADTASV